jgi:hypothetical protein
MQTVLSAWYNKKEGLTHRLLKSTCLSYLKGGEAEVRFEDGIADILYNDTVIECLSKPTRSDIAYKIERYKSRKLIIAVPADTPEEIFEGFDVTVWFVDPYKGAIVEKRFKPSPEYLLGAFIKQVERTIRVAIAESRAKQCEAIADKEVVIARRKIWLQGEHSLAITLPKGWCEMHGWVEGTKIVIKTDGERLILEKKKEKGGGR